MPLITRVMSRFDARITATVSLASFAVTFNMRSGWSTDADFWTFALPSVVQGFAASTFFVSLVTLTLNGLRPAQIPAASGLSNFIRLTAASFAASITTTAYDSGAAMHQTRLAEAMGAHGEALAGAVTRMQAAGYGAGQALTAITEQVVRQAYTLSLLDIYRASAWVVLLAIPCVWFTSRAVGDSKRVLTYYRPFDKDYREKLNVWYVSSHPWSKCPRSADFLVVIMKPSVSLPAPNNLVTCSSPAARPRTLSRSPAAPAYTARGRR